MPDAVPTELKWREMTKDVASSSALGKCAQLISDYHHSWETFTDERIGHLTEIVRTCATHLMAVESVTDRAPYVMLGMAAEKQKGIISKAVRSWAIARKAVGPGWSHYGSTIGLKHSGVHAATPTASGNYWLERLDPKHRLWAHGSATLFDDWIRDSTTPLNFWDWLVARGQADKDDAVQYLAPDSRWKYWVKAKKSDGLLYHADDKGEHTTLFTTKGMTSGEIDHIGIWACSPGGVFYSNAHAVGAFHHSSFLAGERVLGAGEWIVSNGKILLIGHKTGHYQAGPVNLANSLYVLRLRGARLEKTVVEVVDFTTHLTEYYKANDFIDANGKCAGLEPYKVPIPSSSAIPAHIRALLGGGMNPRLAALRKVAAGQDWG